MNLVRLTSDYELTSFDCGNDQLNKFLFDNTHIAAEYGNHFFLSPLLLISLATDATMQYWLIISDLRVARAVARVA